MLKRLKNLELDYLISAVVICLMATGTIFVFSAGVNLSSELTLSNFLSSVRFRNIIFFPIAIGFMYFFSFVNYRIFSLQDKQLLKSPIFYLLILSFILLVLVLIPKIGVEVNQARRWLRVGIGGFALNFQPSELAKWVIIVFLASFLDKYYEQMRFFFKRFAVLCAIIGLIVILIGTQDFGTAAFIGLMAFIMMLLGGAVWWHFTTPIPLAAALGYIAIAGSATRMNRLKAFLNPEQYEGTSAYQANQSLIAIATGGVYGRGLGYGVSNYGHLPEDTTDFIYAIVAHELGLAGSLFIILLYLMFLFFGVLVILRCPDRFGKLLASGIVIAVGLQAALNLGVVTVVLPTKGIPLPFVSAGGTSLLLSALAVGILINIARQHKPDSALTIKGGWL